MGPRSAGISAEAFWQAGSGQRPGSPHLQPKRLFASKERQASLLEQSKVPTLALRPKGLRGPDAAVGQRPRVSERVAETAATPCAKAAGAPPPPRRPGGVGGRRASCLKEATGAQGLGPPCVAAQCCDRWSPAAGGAGQARSLGKGSRGALCKEEGWGEGVRIGAWGGG